MKKPSAAQMVVRDLGYAMSKEYQAALLREDRERRQMELAIVSSASNRFLGDKLERIAERIARKLAQAHQTGHDQQ